MARIQQHMLHLERLSKQYRPFARQVYRLAEAFDDDQIQKLVQQYLTDSTLVGAAPPEE